MRMRRAMSARRALWSGAAARGYYARGRPTLRQEAASHSRAVADRRARQRYIYDFQPTHWGSPDARSLERSPSIHQKWLRTCAARNCGARAKCFGQAPRLPHTKYFTRRACPAETPAQAKRNYAGVRVARWAARTGVAAETPGGARPRATGSMGLSSRARRV